ncbi:MAG: hypothetical protein K8L99_04780 [Anaerolineae bacterium]|nr:hypothetical protein [Anaerolineae bacterium]
MNDNSLDVPAPLEDTVVQVPPSRSLVRRLGCGLGLVLWALLLLSPCILITLAVRGEISIDTGSAPEQRFRMWLIMEANERGVGLSNGWVASAADPLCIQTDVKFYLWEGEAEPVSFCKCYDDGDNPQLQEMITGTCNVEE